MSQTDSQAIERIKQRYPRSRMPQAVVVVLIGLLAVVFLVWLIWAAWHHANPAVSGQVAGYQVVSDQQISVTITVDRPDPSVPITCEVVAKAENFEEVGRISVVVGERPERLVNVTQDITTFRRATSASVESCTVS